MAKEWYEWRKVSDGCFNVLVRWRDEKGRKRSHFIGVSSRKGEMPVVSGGHISSVASVDGEYVVSLPTRGQ